MPYLRSHRTINQFLSIWVIFSFVLSSLFSPRSALAQDSVDLPTPGSMVNMSQEYVPPILRGVRIYPDNPFRFDFYVDTGDSNLADAEFSAESRKLIKYFLAGLTVPEEDLWVNLSPYENNRIIPEGFGFTELGRDLLAQDYLLKQLTASLLYPEEETGSKFWDKAFHRAYELFGTTNIPINTFNKVWIVPKEAVVYEKGDAAYILDSRLQVMLEEDYLALKKNMGSEELGTNLLEQEKVKDVNNISSSVVREVVIPEIEKEVNAGKNFSELRQIYSSLVLAAWFKKQFKESFLGVNYIDQNKVAGVDVNDKLAKQKIYERYLEAFRKGVYNYIKEDYDRYSKVSIPRKYFSGGFAWKPANRYVRQTSAAGLAAAARGNIRIVQSGLIESYEEHEDLIDEALLKRAFDQKYKDEIEAKPVAPAQAGQDLAVTRALNFLQDLDGSGQSALILDDLVKQRLPGATAGTVPQLNRIIIKDSKIEPSVRGHASDRGIHLFIKENSRLADDDSEQAAIIIHEFIAFMGQQHPYSTAFEVLFRAVQKNPQSSLAELLTRSELNEIFQQQLASDGWTIAHGPWSVSLEKTIQQGLESIRDHLLRHNGRRQADLLSRLSQRKKAAPGPGRRDYTAPSTIHQVLSQTDRLRYYEPQEKIFRNDLLERIRKQDEEYINKFLVKLAQATTNPVTGQVTADQRIIQRNQLLAEIERMKIVKQWYAIGEEALGLEKKKEEAGRRNFIVAMIAFNKVKEMKPSLRDSYSESVLTSDEFKPPQEVYEMMLTKDKVEKWAQLKPEELGLSAGSPEYKAIQGGLEEYRKILDLIKRAEKRYRDSYQRYMQEIIQESDLATAAIENIIYDLRISDLLLFRGIDNTDGRPMKQLLQSAVGLRELLYSEDPRITDGMKAQAAKFLAVLFSKHMYFGDAYAHIDQNGGLSVTEDVHDLDMEANNLEGLREAETEAFAMFMYNGKEDTLAGHSYTAMSWLAKFYQKLSQYYYLRPVEDAIELESRKHRKDLADAFRELESKNTYEEMVAVYKSFFPKADARFLDGEFKGARTEIPIREEEQAAGIGDSTFLATNKPYLFRGLFNASKNLTREDGTVGRNIEVTFEVRDIDKMPKGDGNQLSYLTIESLDRNFSVHVTKAADAVKKTKADLVLQSLVSMGLLPDKLMKRAISEGRQREVLREVFQHVLGKDKGLHITLHVKNIQASSGLAVSSLISASVAQTFDQLLYARSQDAQLEYTNRLTLDVAKDGSDVGEYYFIEVSRNKDFSNEDEIYRFPTQVDENKQISVDMALEQFPVQAEDGQYYVRYRWVKRTYDKKRREIFDPERWFPEQSQAVTWTTLERPIPLKKDGEPEEETVANAKIERRRVEYRMIDDQESVARAIIASQYTVWRLAGMAGVQDEVAGLVGGMRILIAGDPLEGKIKGRDVKLQGGIVPQMVTITLSEEAKKNINKGIRIMRIGKSQPAEDTLLEVFVNSILNRSLDIQYTWAQITQEMLKAAQLGDTVAMGRWALAAVALRHQLASVSIDDTVLRVLNKFVREYGKSHGFSYGITGARSTGSVLLFFDPNLEEKEIAKVLDQVAAQIKDEFAKLGKVEAIDEDPKVYKYAQLAERGARIQFLTPEEMKWQKQRINANRALKRAELIRARSQRTMYTQKEVEATEQEFDVPKEIPAMTDSREALTMDQELAKTIKNYYDEAKKQRRSLTAADRRAIRRKASLLLQQNFRRFNSPSINYEVRRFVRKRIKKNVSLIQKLVKSQRISAKQERLFFEAVANEQVSLLWPFEKEDNLRDLVLRLEEGRDTSDLAKIYQASNDVNGNLNSKLREAEEEYEDAAQKKFDGVNLRTPEFTQDLEKELGDLGIAIKDVDEQVQTLKRKQNKELADNRKLHDLEQRLYDLKIKWDFLKYAPDPTTLPFNHFIFEESTTYKKHFGIYVQTLREAVKEGALVDIISAGGMGSRFFGGEAVKAAVQFHFGHLSDASFLKIMVLRYADFLKRFPEAKKGFIHAQVSAFTRDAIQKALDEIAREAGFDRESVAVASQGLWPVTWPSELELIAEIAKIKASTDQAYEESVRSMKWVVEEAEKEAAFARQSNPNIKRARYTRGGLNPLQVYAPTGNFGSWESIFRPGDKYTLANLRAAGYTIDEDRVDLIVKAGLSEEMGKGMSLAKASLLVKGKGLSVGIIQNSSSLAPIGGGDIALGFSAYQIWNKGAAAVPSYSNVAGGTNEGGFLAVEKNDPNNTVAIIEGDRVAFAEGFAYEEDFTSFFHNTVPIDLKGQWRYLGFKNEAEFLAASDKEIKNRLFEIIQKENLIMYNVRTRTEKQPGETLTWKVTQAEVAVPRWLEWLQKKFGRQSVVFFETHPDGFSDAKTRDELAGLLDREITHRITSAPTRVPVGEIENVAIAVHDWLQWGETHLDRQAVGLAWEAAAMARKSWRQGVNDLTAEEREQLRLAIEALEKKIQAGASAEPAQMAEEPPAPEKFDEEFLRLYQEQSSNKFNRFVMLRQQKADFEERLNRLQVFLAQVDSLLARKSPDLIQVLVKVVNHQLQEGVQDSVLLAMAADIINGQGVQEVIQRYTGTKKRITGKMVADIEEMANQLTRPDKTKGPAEIERIFNNTAEPHPWRLAFLKTELTALYAQMIEAILLAGGQVKGLPTSNHKLIILTDKDATLETPGQPLKQSPLIDLKPDRAEEIVWHAIAGARNLILTGSTYKEANEHVLSPIATILRQMQIPRIMKQIAIERIEVLANDGSVRAKLKMEDDGDIVPAPLEFVERYENGEWFPARNLKLTRKEIREGNEVEVEDMRNRLILWNSSIRSYLKQLYAEKGGWKLLTGQEAERTEEERKSFEEFIDRLSLKENDLVDFTTTDAAADFLNMFEPLAWAIERMLDADHLKDRDLNPGALNWKKRFEQIFQNGKGLEGKLEKKELALTAEEQLYATMRLLYFKDSAWTYGSISGDELDKKRKDERFSSLVDLILNPGFWDKVNENVNGYVDRAIENWEKKAATDWKMFTRDENGVEQKVIKEFRSGPGYENMVFGGVSKKIITDALLDTEETHGYVFIVSGDSYKDQGNFPYRLQTKIPAGTAINIKEIKAQLYEEGNTALADKLELKNNTLAFVGEMARADYDRLMAIGQNQAWQTQWQKAIEYLYGKSNSVHKEKIALRYLLGTPFELDAEQIENFMSAGLLRVESKNATLNPLDPRSNERTGPALYYFMVNAVMGALQEGVIIPYAEDQASGLEPQNKLERAVIAAGNKLHEPGVRFVPSTRLKTIKPGNLPAEGDRALLTEDQDEVGEAVIDSSRYGGIDFTNTFVLKIKRDDLGVPATFNWTGEKINIQGFYPVIYAIIPTGKDSLAEILGISQTDTDEAEGKPLKASLNVQGEDSLANDSAVAEPVVASSF